jgi:hypothetical protein
MYQLRMYRWDSDKDKPDYYKNVIKFDSLGDAQQAGYKYLYGNETYPFSVVFSDDTFVRVLFDPCQWNFPEDKKEDAVRLKNYFDSLTNTNPMKKTIKVQIIGGVSAKSVINSELGLNHPLTFHAYSDKMKARILESFITSKGKIALSFTTEELRDGEWHEPIDPNSISAEYVNLL